MENGRDDVRDSVSRRLRKQRGSVLILAALLLCVFFAVAAAIVDLGVARVTQDAMQSAADTAALEGLRFRDAVGDVERRLRASSLVSEVFDDDLTPENGDSEFLGAGPIVPLASGQAGVNASAFVDFDPDAPVMYDPILEPNLGNEQSGDLVAGDFLGAGALHVEDGGYSRGDFVPSSASTAPTAPAFLVRLRRTNDDLGLDSESGVSTHGPTLPYLFAMGSLLDAEHRNAGIPVRATGIARSERANFIAVVPGMPGPELHDLALFESQLPPVDVPQTYAVAPTGGISNAQSGIEVGEFTSSADLAASSRPNFVGILTARVPPPANVTAVIVKNAVLPVIAQDLAIDHRVIGFVSAEFTITPPNALSLTRRSSILAANGSALAARALASLAASPPLATAHALLDEPVLAPVLAR